jgi:hypothetical protein
LEYTAHPGTPPAPATASRAGYSLRTDLRINRIANVRKSAFVSFPMALQAKRLLGYHVVCKANNPPLRVRNTTPDARRVRCQFF